MRQLKVSKHMTVGRHFMHRSEEYLIEGQSRAWVEFSRTQEVEHADSRNLLHCALGVVRSSFAGLFAGSSFGSLEAIFKLYRTISYKTPLP